MAQFEVDSLPKPNLARLLQIRTDSHTNPHTFFMLVQSEQVAHVKNKFAFYSKHLFNLYLIVFTIAECLHSHVFHLDFLDFCPTNTTTLLWTNKFHLQFFPRFGSWNTVCWVGFEQAANRFNRILLVIGPKEKGFASLFESRVHGVVSWFEHVFNKRLLRGIWERAKERNLCIAGGHCRWFLRKTSTDPSRHCPMQSNAFDFKLKYDARVRFSFHCFSIINFCARVWIVTRWIQKRSTQTAIDLSRFVRMFLVGVRKVSSTISFLYIQTYGIETCYFFTLTLFLFF